MKIFFDQVSSEYHYPLSQKEVKQIREKIPNSFLEKIGTIRFGCNTKTTQEGRLVKRGDAYDIRINFCLNRMRSLILSDKKEYLAQIEKFGGKINSKHNQITWEIPNAKRYSFFILLHEIAHVIYCEEKAFSTIGNKGSEAEEQWCNDFAEKTLKNIVIN